MFSQNVNLAWWWCVLNYDCYWLIAGITTWRAWTEGCGGRSTTTLNPSTMAQNLRRGCSPKLSKGKIQNRTNRKSLNIWTYTDWHLRLLFYVYSMYILCITYIFQRCWPLARTAGQLPEQYQRKEWNRQQTMLMVTELPTKCRNSCRAVARLTNI